MKLPTRTLQAAAVVLLGLWTLAGTEVHADESERCDQVICVSAMTCSSESTTAVCNTECPQAVYAWCDEAPGSETCGANEYAFSCVTQPD